ncbi:MAG: universal stress protein [Clostridia bacterium]|nr:MAG: universal stress protein [Clostridia bacterium]
MFKRILVGYDGSLHARKAIELALDLAQRYTAAVTAVAVAHIPDFADTRDEINGALQDAEKFFGGPLQQAAKRAAQMDVALETRVVPGHPADVLVRLAEAEDCDLIVVGARGLSGVKRYLMGSVSEAVVRHAHCPVLVVKG